MRGVALRAVGWRFAMDAWDGVCPGPPGDECRTGKPSPGADFGQRTRASAARSRASDERPAWSIASERLRVSSTPCQIQSLSEVVTVDQCTPARWASSRCVNQWGSRMVAPSASPRRSIRSRITPARHARRRSRRARGRRPEQLQVPLLDLEIGGQGVLGGAQEAPTARRGPPSDRAPRCGRGAGRRVRPAPGTPPRRARPAGRSSPPSGSTAWARP